MRIHKGMTNLELVDLLDAVSAAYKLKGENKNRFRIIAYERASDAVEHLSSEAKDLWDDEKLTDIAGIGKRIASYLDEIFRTGKSKHFEEVLGGLPPAMFVLMRISGIGPKTAYKLVTTFDINEKTAFVDLRKIAEKGEIAKMEGFGEDSQEAILKSLKEVSKRRKKRLLLPYAEKLAREIIDWITEDKSALRADPLGSLRRKTSTVGDVDISVASNNPTKVIEHFVNYPNASRVLAKGENKASILIPGNKRVDLMVENLKSYGSLLQHFTGSKHHNITLREYANKKGLSLSEHGIKATLSQIKNLKLKIKNYSTLSKLSDRSDSKLQTIKVSTEKEFYKLLGMQWIPPELREDMGEIEASIERKLPDLVEEADINGDLHMHSDFDIETSHDLGQSPMKVMVQKADSLNYEYIAFSEHNPSKSGHTDKQIVEILKRKKEAVEKMNIELGILNIGLKKVFNSLEIDMLKGGELPVSDTGLDLLDFALVSIHSSFNLSRKEMTERVLKSLAHPKVKVFAHPTTRILNQREGVELDWEQIFDYCKKNSKWLEINASPSRLDLPDVLVKDAIENGVMLSLGTDSHHVDSMDLMKYGVYVARRGWAEKKNIANTRHLNEFEKMLE